MNKTLLHQAAFRKAGGNQTIDLAAFKQVALRRCPALWSSSLFGYNGFIQMIQTLFYHRRVFNTGDRLNRATALIADFGINIKYAL